jgi:hypothetical protein
MCYKGQGSQVRASLVGISFFGYFVLLQVWIYRMLTTGTIEEKVYQRQLAKMVGGHGWIVVVQNRRDVVPVCGCMHAPHGRYFGICGPRIKRGACQPILLLFAVWVHFQGHCWCPFA